MSWQHLIVQVARPEEDGSSPGAVVEGDWTLEDGEIVLQTQHGRYTETLRAGDSPRAVAMRLLRSKSGGARRSFHDPFKYKPQSIA